MALGDGLPQIQTPQANIPIISPQNQVDTNAGNISGAISAYIQSRSKDADRIANAFAQIPTILQKKKEQDLAKENFDLLKQAKEDTEKTKIDAGNYVRAMDNWLQTGEDKYYEEARGIGSANTKIYNLDFVQKYGPRAEAFKIDKVINPILTNPGVASLLDISSTLPDPLGTFSKAISGTNLDPIKTTTVDPETGKPIEKILYDPMKDQQFKDAVVDFNGLGEIERAALIKRVQENQKQLLLQRTAQAQLGNTLTENAVKLAISNAANQTSIANTQAQIQSRESIAQFNADTDFQLEAIKQSNKTQKPKDRFNSLSQNPEFTYQMISQLGNRPQKDILNVPTNGTKEQWNESLQSVGIMAPNDIDISGITNQVVFSCAKGVKSLDQCVVDAAKDLLPENDTIDSFSRKVQPKNTSPSRRNLYYFLKYYGTPQGQTALKYLIGNVKYLANPSVNLNLQATNTDQQATPTPQPVIEIPTPTPNPKKTKTERITDTDKDNVSNVLNPFGLDKSKFLSK